MAPGQVRAVLLQHLQGRPATPAQDPAGFVPAPTLETALDAMSPAEQRGRGHDYVRLWARTFPTLVRQLRGRPEEALRLWCQEVYPYLRGERRAARIEAQDLGTAKILLADDLPPAYLAGLVEAFVGLSRADAEARPLGDQTFQVTFRVHPSDRLAWGIRAVAELRIPLLLTAALAAVFGIALAGGGTAWWDGPLALLAVLGAQAAANALQDLRSRAGNPLRVREPRLWHWLVLGGGYTVAAAATAYFVLLGRWGVLAFAAAGLLLSLAYPPIRDRGLGPVFAGISHGPLIVAGTLYALTGDLAGHDPLTVLLLSLPLAALTAAILYTDDLADRPLDEASGKRTLAVRIPQGRHLFAYAVLLGLGIATALAVAATVTRVGAALVALVALPTAWILLRSVQHHLDDPRHLAGARLGTIALHTLTTVALSLVLGGIVP